MESLGSKRLIATASGRYAVWSRGDGPLVVLLHGWPVSSYHFRHLMPALDASGFEAIAIDLNGLGESSAAGDDFRKESLARDIWQLFGELVPDHGGVSLVGHDWGGSIAIAMAALERGRVRRLVVEDEIPPGIEAPLRGEGSKRYPTWHGGLHRTVGLAEDLIRGKEERYLSFFLDLRASAASLPADLRQHYIDLHRSEEKTRVALAYYRFYQADSDFFRRLQAAKLDIPVLAAYGAYGMGPAVLDSLRTIASSVSDISFDQSGHYPAEEEPEAFNAAVSAFLRGQ